MKTIHQQGNYSDIEFPLDAINEICVMGDNEDAVGRWMPKLNLPDNEAMLKEISEYDDYDGLTDDAIAIQYVWVMAWNAHDDMDESLNEVENA